MIGIYWVALLALAAVVPAAVLAEKNIRQIQSWQKLDQKIDRELRQQKASVQRILQANQRLAALRQACPTAWGHPAMLAALQAEARLVTLKQEFEIVRVFDSAGTLLAENFQATQLPQTFRSPAPNACKLPSNLEFRRSAENVIAEYRHRQEIAGARLTLDADKSDWRFYYPRRLPR